MKNTKLSSTKTKLIKTKKVSDKIILNGYTKLLSGVQNYIKQTQNNIITNVTREKVVMAWEIGKIIDEHLSRNSKSGYGEKLLEQLEQDVSMSKAVLYKMRSFFQTYKKLPKDDDQLNWTHYQMLSGVKKADERKRLENLTKQSAWDTDALQTEVKKSKDSQTISEETPITKSKNGNGKFAKKDANGNVIRKAITNTKLRLERGKLFSYPLIKIEGPNKTYIDLGFSIFREFKDDLPKVSAVDVVKKKEKYSFNKSDTHPRKFNTYKAYLERIVDGDTIHVTIDLGFETFHKEIIRLKGIDSPEMSTDAGKKSAKFLTNLLKDLPFLIVKTIKIDIYGRYVADVFYSETKEKLASEIDPQKVADEGVYLNQLLLDEGFAVVLNM